MKSEIIRKSAGRDGESGIRTVLCDVCEDFISSISASGELEVPDGCPAVRLVLGGEDEAGDWGVDGDAVGFFAIISPRRFDEDGEQWFDVNEHMEVHLNLDLAAALFAEVEDDDLIPELEAWLVTVPHELLHAADWMRATGGKVPTEVFDAGEGELGIKAVLDGIDAEYARLGRDLEDDVEERARAIVGRVTSNGMALAPYAERILALRGSRPAAGA